MSQDGKPTFGANHSVVGVEDLATGTFFEALLGAKIYMSGCSLMNYTTSHYYHYYYY